MPQLTAAEIYAHPEFGKVPWEGQPTEEGFVDVAQGRGGPISIAYEIHGTGPNKLVVSGMISILEADFSGFFDILFLKERWPLSAAFWAVLWPISPVHGFFSGHTFNYGAQGGVLRFLPGSSDLLTSL